MQCESHDATPVLPADCSASMCRGVPDGAVFVERAQVCCVLVAPRPAVHVAATQFAHAASVWWQRQHAYYTGGAAQ